MNLPNLITMSRIAMAPLIAALPFWPSAGYRFTAFGLFVIAAVTDYYDGMLARSRNLVTDLGRLLDPLADKLLLVATLTPMCILMAPRENFVAPLIDRSGLASQFAFTTPIGDVPLPWWIVLIVVSREVFMTLLRQSAAKRGFVIAAIGPAKWKTAFQSIWVGSAFFWFGASTLAAEQGWRGMAWTIFAHFNGLVGTISMLVAVTLTVYSLWLYLRQYRHVFAN